MEKIVKDKQEEIARLCKKYKVKRLDVLGPMRVGYTGRDLRDMDFLVSFHDPDAHKKDGFKSPYFRLMGALGDLFAGELDHVFLGLESTPRDPDYKRWIDEIREMVYVDRAA